MKKKALLLFTLIFWLAGACTFLSIKVEEEMIPQVTATETDRYTGTLPGDCLIEDENGVHLYKIYEGTGWEAGTRVTEESNWFPDENGNLVSGDSWGDFVQYSSKPLKEGEIVEVIRRGDKVEDHWLAVFPEGEMPEIDIESLPSGIEFEESGGNAIQFSVENDMAPFMPGRAKSRIPELAGATVYSFNDMYQLLNNFSAIGLLLGILVVVLVLWIFSCVFAKDVRHYKWCLILNLVVGIVLLACIPLVLGQMDLPSSLLPRERITDLGDIANSISEFFSALKGFAPSPAEPALVPSGLPQSEAGNMIIFEKNSVIARPVVYGILGLLAAGITVLVERVAVWHINRPRVK